MSGNRHYSETDDRSELRMQIARARRRLDRRCRDAINPFSSCENDPRHPFRWLLTTAACIARGWTPQRSSESDLEDGLVARAVRSVLSRLGKEIRSLQRRTAKSTMERRDG